VALGAQLGCWGVLGPCEAAERTGGAGETAESLCGSVGGAAAPAAAGGRRQGLGGVRGFPGIGRVSLLEILVIADLLEQSRRGFSNFLTQSHRCLSSSWMPPILHPTAAADFCLLNTKLISPASVLGPEEIQLGEK